MNDAMIFDDWNGVLRIAVTGVLAYLLLIVMLRFSGKRTLSKFNAFDFIVTISIGSMLSSIIITKSIPLVDGIAGLAVLIGLQYVITWLSIRSERFQNLIKSQPTLLVHRGVFQESSMKTERVTREEIETALRGSGKSEMTPALSVILETDGSLNVFQAA